MKNASERVENGFPEKISILGVMDMSVMGDLLLNVSQNLFDKSKVWLQVQNILRFDIFHGDIVVKEDLILNTVRKDLEESYDSISKACGILESEDLEVKGQNFRQMRVQEIDDSE